MAKRQTNTAFVRSFMEYGSALRQVFVLTAIQKYAEQCLAEPDSTFDSPLLNGAAWRAVAGEAQAAIEAHFKR